MEVLVRTNYNTGKYPTTYWDIAQILNGLIEKGFRFKEPVCRIEGANVVIILEEKQDGQKAD